MVLSRPLDSSLSFLELLSSIAFLLELLSLIIPISGLGWESDFHGTRADRLGGALKSGRG